MITTTLGAIAKGFTGGEINYKVYVISAEDIPLYVGKSSDAVTRVLSHLGMGEWTGFYGSDFDMRLKTYNGWEDFIVTLHESSYPDWTESELIYELSPVFNAMKRKRSFRNAEQWWQMHPDPVIRMSR